MNAIPIGSARTQRERLVADGMVNTTEAANWLGVSMTTLWRMMDRGELPWVHIGRGRYIPRRALIELATDGLKWRR